MTGRGSGNAYTHLIVSILFNIFMTLEPILFIVLRSCPGTALVPMNFGWVGLGFVLFFYMRYFQEPANINGGMLRLDVTGQTKHAHLFFQASFGTPLRFIFPQYFTFSLVHLS